MPKVRSKRVWIIISASSWSFAVIIFAVLAIVVVSLIVDYEDNFSDLFAGVFALGLLTLFLSIFNIFITRFCIKNYRISHYGIIGVGTFVKRQRARRYGHKVIFSFEDEHGEIKLSHCDVTLQFAKTLEQMKAFPVKHYQGKAILWFDRKKPKGAIEQVRQILSENSNLLRDEQQ